MATVHYEDKFDELGQCFWIGIWLQQLNTMSSLKLTVCLTNGEFESLILPCCTEARNERNGHR